jgi:hypothetical protein
MIVRWDLPQAAAQADGSARYNLALHGIHSIDDQIDRLRVGSIRYRSIDRLDRYDRNRNRIE